MKKDNKNIVILSTVLCLLPIFAGLLMYDKLPDQIVTHINFAGEADGYASKFVGIVVLPGIFVALNLLLPLLLKMDPKYENISKTSFALLHWIMPLISLFVSSITIMASLGNYNLNTLTPLFMGFMFLVIGNYLPKMSQSYTVGIRLPWTLNDEENWDKTHRFAGFLWTGIGLIMIIVSFFKASMVITIVLALLLVILPAIYSYVLYLRKNH